MNSPLTMLPVVLLCLAASCSSDKRKTVRHMLPQDFTGQWECIVYGVEGALPLQAAHDMLTAPIPQDGILLTSTELPSEGCDDTFFYSLASGGLDEIPDERVAESTAVTGSITSELHGIDCDFHATWVGNGDNASSHETLKQRIVQKLLSHYKKDKPRHTSRGRNTPY